MQFNWGTGIALFYTLFAGTMVYMVFKSTGYDHSLVREDYYAADLAYQEHYNKLSNSRELPLRVLHQAGSDVIKLELQIEREGRPIEGEVVFFRPSNQRHDFTLPLTLNADGLQNISTTDLLPGLWRMKIDWTLGKEAHYTEVDVVL